MIKGPWQRQAYLTFAALMTLSRYLAYTYGAYAQSDTDLGDFIPKWNDVFNPPSHNQNWQNIFGVTASVLAMLSVACFILALFYTGPAGFAFGLAGSVVWGGVSIFNGAINFANSQGSELSELEFRAYGNAMSSMKIFINQSQQILVDTHNAYFLKGQ